MAYGEVGGGDDESVLVALEAIELCEQGIDHTHGVGRLVARDGRLARRRETLHFVNEHTDEGVVILENLLLGIGPQ